MDAQYDELQINETIKTLFERSAEHGELSYMLPLFQKLVNQGVKKFKLKWEVTDMPGYACLCKQTPTVKNPTTSQSKMNENSNDPLIKLFNNIGFE
ncbi:hypothetical protein GJ496_000551 [Pomphorhynchus laevis]|nr:hypothetical protein GJ496_000551 [Pomphorhynchus laevis]